MSRSQETEGDVPRQIIGGTSASPAPSNNDVPRFWFGAAAFGIGGALLVGVSAWALFTLHRVMFDGAPLKPVPLAAGWLLVAKGILVATVGGFGVALLRLGERLTMPLTLYLQLVEHQSRRGSKEQSAEDLVELMQNVRKLIDVATKLPPAS
jgi:hypothetical protein